MNPSATGRLWVLGDTEVTSLEHTIAERGHEDPRVKLLLTMPGVKVTVAQTLLAALGDITRFAMEPMLPAIWG